MGMNNLIACCDFWLAASIGNLSIAIALNSGPQNIKAPFSHGEATVLATFRTHRGFYDTGSTIAKSGCWSMLKGGLTVIESGSALLYFQSKNASIDIWVDQRLLSRNNGTDDLQVSDPLFGAGHSDSASALSAELAVPVSSKILIACIGDGRWYVGYSSGFEV
ncbi:carbohydrate-binding, CenC-like protein [Tanacetum coccineum]